MQAFWIAPMDALPLRVFEIAFTLAFFFRLGRNFMNWEEWLTAAGYHPTSEQYLAMGYPQPMPLLEPWMVPFFAMLLFGSGLAIILNKRRRLALWIILGCAFYAQAVDYFGSFAYNKIFIAVYALLATGPGPYRNEEGRLVVSAAMVRMIQATLVTLYFAAGIAKAFNGDWLKYNDVLWTHVQGFHRNELAALLLRHIPLWMWTVMQHSALAFELLAPVLFCVPRLRWIGIAYGIVFHLMIAALMSGLIYFSVQMWSFYAVWITASQWRLFWEALRRKITTMR